MIEKKNRLLSVLVVLLIVPGLLYGLFSIPFIHHRYMSWLHAKDTVLVYVPHRAPDSACLGKYETIKGPFVVPMNSETDIIVENHRWSADVQKHTYRTVADGYMHVKQPDGSYVDEPAHIEETNKYDTLHTQQPAMYHLPVAKAVPKEVPDSVHLPSSGEEQQLRALLKKLRGVKLPYTYMGNSNMELTVTDRKISTETIHDTIFLKTKLTCTARFIDGQYPTQTITLQGTEPLNSL